MPRKRKQEAEIKEETHEVDENEPPQSLRRSKRSRTQVKKYEAKEEHDPTEEEDDHDDENSPVRARKAPAKSAARGYSGAFRNSKQLIRHPKSIAKTEDGISKISFNDAVPVDAECPLKDTFKVYADSRGDHYHAMLNQTNISANNNKYYLLQVLEHRKGDGYAVWFRWGRVGRIAGTMPCKYQKGEDGLEAALNDFMKKFHDKTKNDWHDRANFTKFNGKYDFVEQDFGANVKEEIKEEIDEDVKIEPCTLADEIQELIKMICDVRMMESFAKEMKFDIERAPLGKLTETQIQNGIKILKKIEDAVLKSSSSTLSKLTSQFYTRIPHDFGMTRPPVISSLEAVKEEYELLESLRQITIAINVKESGGAHIDPTTKAFNNLNSVIQVKTGHDFNFVQTLLTDTHGPTHSAYSLKLESLFLVQREGEKERYNDKIGNDTLLWHGSRTSNFAGIIKNGLRIAPPEAPVTGYMFGKGVYFADCASKSANYCHANESEPHGLLILCRVALGKEKILYAADGDLPENLGKHDSIKAIGQNVPSKEDEFASAIVHSGSLVKYEKLDLCSLLYNEYVVYDTKQIEILYVAKVKFDYGNDSECPW